MKEEKRLLNKISTIFNRSVQQTNFLFELLNKDYGKLITLELKIKNNFISYCPGDLEEVDKIMSLKDKTDYFKIQTFPKGTLKIRVEDNNINVLKVEQIKDNGYFQKTITIPPGKNRTDIITNIKIGVGYTYKIDPIIIITNNETRKIYHLNILQLEYDLKNGNIIYKNKYEHIKKI